MSRWPFTRGLHDLGSGGWAYLQPDGTWGWSNAGLIESRGETLLVDTLMGVKITADMLDEMRRSVPAAERIGWLVNTHSNPDHVLGNQLVADAEIISAKATAEAIAAMNPENFVNMTRNWKAMGDGGEFMFETMGRKFDFTGVTVTPPTRTFVGEMDLRVGDKTVHLVDLGPAHTEADTIVYVPEDRVVFTGDLLFNEGHPIVWSGPVQNWIDACDYMLGLDVETVVPGHGPITDKSAVRTFKTYLEYIRAEARARYDAGIGWEQAGREIALDAFKGWTDEERIVANVFALYREFGAAFGPNEGRDLFGAMGRYRKHKHADGEHDHAHG
jgi:glyoxylase-like metal-dependent hydrolase (beta-lactamase superfamily II)